MRKSWKVHQYLLLKCINQIINHSFIFIKDNFDAHERSKRSTDYYDNIYLICDPDHDEVSTNYCTKDQIKDNTQARALDDIINALVPDSKSFRVF